MRKDDSVVGDVPPSISQEPQQEEGAHVTCVEGLPVVLLETCKLWPMITSQIFIFFFKISCVISVCLYFTELSLLFCYAFIHKVILTSVRERRMGNSLPLHIVTDFLQKSLCDISTGTSLLFFCETSPHKQMDNDAPLVL